MNEAKTERIGFLNVLIIVLSIYVLMALVIDTFFKLPVEVSRVLLLIDNAICLVFIADFFIRFKQSKNRLKFMRWGWIDLIFKYPII